MELGVEEGGLVARGLELAVRLPPLYLMDTILVHNLGVWTKPSHMTPTPLDPELVPTNLTEAINNSSDLYSTFSQLYGGSPLLLILPHIARFSICSFLYLVSLLVFFLPSSQLVTVYRHVACLAVIPASYAGHRLMVDTIQGGDWGVSWVGGQYLAQWPLLEGGQYLAQLPLLSLSLLDSPFSRAVGANYLLQTGLAMALRRLLRLSGHYSHRARDYLGGVMVLPCLLALLSLPSPALALSAFLASLLPAALLGTSLGQQAAPMLQSLVSLYIEKRNFVNNFGLNTFLEAEWGRLRVPAVLRTFWLSRAALLLLMQEPGSLPAVSLYTTGREVLVRGSETVLSVLGMTSIVSTISHWFGIVFQMLLKTEDDDEKSVASVSAVLFFVLALQTGLTGMDSEKRFQQICKNLCLLLTAVLHFIHSMVQPVLMSLSASRSSNRASHVRALSICLFLLLAPSLLVFLLWTHFTLGTWLLAVTAFCVEVVVKVLVTVTVYGLFMWDAHCQDGLWESLDDCVYYIRAFGNTVEFCFAVFLFFNGGWILVFESGGTIRAIMMLIHAYFNIWCEAKSGWSTFSKRRTAVAKIDSLEDATGDQLEKHNDVCSICYQDMASAKVTRCRHMYHAICLRKWLYMQDSCPMCHEKLYQSDATSQTEEQVELLVPRPGDLVVLLDPEEGAEIQDINDNYLEESDDYIDLSDTEEELEE